MSARPLTVDALSAAELAAELPFARARRRLAAMGHAVREKHSGGASSLLLGDGGHDELVVHYPPAGAPHAWRYPADPALVHLADPAELLARAAWDPPLEPRVAAAGVQARLMYNPGRRAAFLLRATGSPVPVVLKLLSPSEAPASLRALRAIAASGLDRVVPMPRLLAAAETEGAVLLEYLPGTLVGDWTPDVLDQVAEVLAAVHALELDGMPAWTADRDVAKLERLLDLLDAAAPAAGAALRPLATRLAARLSGARRLATTTIHRDFTKRHILLVPGAAGAPRVGVLDWDSVSTGPPEKDLATLVAGLRAEGAELIDRYERTTGRTLDRDFVGVLVQTQRLTRACRRLLAGERPAEWATETAAGIAAALARNPLAAT
jgi:aminoglycoside phosphotransferase (APT) family kinase protein